MKYLQIKSYRIFKLILELELQRSMLKYVISNLLLPIWTRQYALVALSCLPIQSSSAYLKLRCISSNQSRSIITYFKLNRMQLKKMIATSLLSGVHKASW